MIDAKIIADSVAPHGGRITTFVLKYPRFVHAEFMTHRVFSRNASSSRAIPVKKMMAQVYREPAVPMHWGANRPGMQATEELTGWRGALARRLWLLARFPALAVVGLMTLIGLHKQVANRLLEPWLHITVVCTATEFGNFFNLRYHHMAEPHMQELAKQMWQLMEHSQPRQLKANEWHLPFVRGWEVAQGDVAEADLLIRSVARCARVSYLNHEGRPTTPTEDADLFKRLLGSNPKHASPAEHQAMALPIQSAGLRSGNFVGWLQHRHCIENENMPVFKGPA